VAPVDPIKPVAPVDPAGPVDPEFAPTNDKFPKPSVAKTCPAVPVVAGRVRTTVPVLGDLRVIEPEAPVSRLIDIVL
jgi:hypothetical protein